MSPDLSHVRVTVVDFMGVFLPGTVWALLLFTLQATLQKQVPGTTPVGVTITLFQDMAPSLGVGFYILTVVAALISGYVAKYVAITLLEPLSTLLDWPLARLAQRLHVGTNWTMSVSDYRFPYNAIHRGAAYYETLADLAESRLRLPRDQIPPSEFFGTFKRLLKLHAPSLWEEAEHREAEVRMLASLVLASLFSIFLALLQAIVGGEVNLSWTLTSVAATLFLNFAYRLRRRREVQSVYFATLAALPMIPASSREELKPEGKKHNTTLAPGG